MGGFHNIKQLFRKDPGAHFSYNFGVTFMRSGLVFLIIMIISGVISLIKPDVRLTYAGTAQAAVVNSEIVKHVTHVRSRTRVTYTYEITFSVKNHDGTTEIIAQNMSRDAFGKYRLLKGLPYQKYNVYNSNITSRRYISTDKKSKALREYKKTHSGLLTLIMSGTAIATFFLSSAMFSFGAREIRLAMKYPRTDFVPTSSDIVVKQGKMNSEEEMNEAQRKRAELEMRYGTKHDTGGTKALPDNKKN